MGSIKEIEHQENAVLETAIEINSPSETKSDRSPHNGKKIDEIIVSQYIDDDSYVVTYSENDWSIHGWNIKGNGQQRLDADAYFKLNTPKCCDDCRFVLYKKILVYHSGFIRKYFTKINLVKLEFFCLI